MNDRELVVIDSILDLLKPLGAIAEARVLAYVQNRVASGDLTRERAADHNSNPENRG